MVSVIIPNYNHASYLQKRIESVLNQSFQDFELIILDDKSSDNSVAIIEKYKDHPRISHIVYNKENSGSTFKQWEKGFELASFDYIWIAESDDYADKQFLENAIQKFEKDNTLGVYFSDYHSINDKGEIITSNNLYPEIFTSYFHKYKNMNGKAFCENYLFFSNLIFNASAVVFKKGLLTYVNPSYKKLKLCGDWRMWADVCYTTNIFFDNIKLDFFRMHLQNVRSNKMKLLGVESVENMVYFINKSEEKSVKKKLKEIIAKTWIYSFYLNKNASLNISLIVKILFVDPLFPLRLLKRVFIKILPGAKKYQLV